MHGTCMMMTGMTGTTGTTTTHTGTTSDMIWIMTEMLTGGDGKDRGQIKETPCSMVCVSLIHHMTFTEKCFFLKGHHDQVQR